MQGVMVLMLSQIIIKFVGLIYKIYLTNKEGFGDAGNAIYSAGFQIYTLFHINITKYYIVSNINIEYCRNR